MTLEGSAQGPGIAAQDGLVPEEERLLDAMEAIERIERYTRRGEAAVRADELIQVWVVRHFEVLREADHAVVVWEASRPAAPRPLVPWGDHALQYCRPSPTGYRSAGRMNQRSLTRLPRVGEHPRP